MTWVWLALGVGIILFTKYGSAKLEEAEPEQFPIRKRQVETYAYFIIGISVAQIIGRFYLNVLFYEVATGLLLLWFWKTEPEGEKKKFALYAGIAALALAVLNLLG